MTTHVERVALNQALFRAANERRRSWPERRGESPEASQYLCECADTRCLERFEMAGNDYEAVRANPYRFVVAPGHVCARAERVVEDHEGYAVVEKLGEAARIAEATDPRS
jgi:hypothetical protein